MAFDLVETSTAPESILKHLELFSLCFPHAKHFNRKYLEWLYVQNPAGAVVGFDAFAEGVLAATYVCVPARIETHGRERKALLSLNTATHPDFQGNGLFTKLATRTFSRAVELGYDSVYGVANQNSIGGFVRKLGFRDLGGLDARLALSSIGRLPDEMKSLNFDFIRLWNNAEFEWRLANPANPLFGRISDGNVIVSGRTNLPGVQIAANLGDRLAYNNDFLERIHTFVQPAPLKLFIGRIPTGSPLPGSISIPKRFRPSPLRLIFRDLHDPEYSINPANCYISFLDFDAY